MDTSAYSIAQLADDLKEICAHTKDEREILRRARPLALRAALAKGSWLKPHMYEADAEQGFGVHLLHEEPDHTLALFLPSVGYPVGVPRLTTMAPGHWWLVWMVRK